jgi:hypothetical protein
MTLLFHLLQQLVALLQNKLLRFGLEFIEKKGQRHQPSNSISVRSKQKNNGLNPGAPTSLAPRVGRGVRRVGLTDVGKPAGAHCRAKLIAQCINSFGNSRPSVLPHVICNSKILTDLS